MKTYYDIFSGKFILVMNAAEFGEYLSYKWGEKFNYYLFVEGINVIIFILALICMFVFSMMYTQTSFLDPIVQVKKNYLFAEFMCAMVSAFLLIFISIKSPDASKLAKNLLKLAILVIVVIIGFGFGKMYMDSIYTEEKFAQLYDNEVKHKDETSNMKIEVSLKGAKIIESTQKEEYINENIHNYKVFTRQATLLTVLFFILWVLNIYMLIRVIKKINKLENLKRDDSIVYDEEVNIKY